MRALILGVALCGVVAGLDAAPQLLPSNLSVPFCYERGGIRRWSVLSSPLLASVRCSLSASQDGRELGRGGRLQLPGLTVSVTGDGWLEILSSAKEAPLMFDLDIQLEGDGISEKQRLAVRAAPPARPISYIADFGDDLIDLFADATTGRWRPLEKGPFDQYFRKLQAHGVGRLIIWQSPFPYMADPANYRAEDWQRYASQAEAIIENPELSSILEKRGGVTNWGWLRQLMKVRLTPQFGDLLTRSARDHGIKLTASFRPFEMALDKYYAVPAFDESGTFLWDFHPLASPAVDCHAAEVGFANYRKVLEDMGHRDAGQIDVIEIDNVTDAAAIVQRYNTKRDNLRLVASPFPPLQHDSFVLVRDAEERFKLKSFREIQLKAEGSCAVLKDFQVACDDDGTVRISGIVMPENCRYLVLSDPSASDEALNAPAALPASLFAKAGNELGRVNVYWAAAADDQEGKRTRVGGITSEGDFCSVFFATEAAINRAHTGPLRRSLKEEQLVIDLGDLWSVEMVDFNQPAARRYAVAELRSILRREPFDEIFINTRSHTSLAATLADGRDGVKSLPHYSTAKMPYVHLGIDRAYAPRGAVSDPRLRKLAADRRDVEQITTWQPGEWDDTCQSPDSPFAWRFSRNRGVADGIRALLEDLEQAFPKTRIRVVIPERAQAVANVKAALVQMQKPEGGVYGREYYRHLWASINHIPAIGEGMTMLDLTGLRVAPVFGGIRFLPDRGPFELFVRETIVDMRGNLGSSFHGPHSYFYEGHETLRAADPVMARRGREERIRHLLRQHGEINEVILYEAAAWLRLPLNDPELCGHGFLDQTASPE